MLASCERARPSRMSASETSSSSKWKCRITDTTTIAPPTMTSTRPGSRPGLWRRCSIGSVARVRNTSSAAARVSRKWWMRSLSSAVDAELDGGHRPHRARAADRASWRPPRPAARGRRRRGGRARSTPPGSAPRASAGRCARNCSVSRTQPMSTEIRPSGCVGPDDELRRAAADVEDEVRRRARSSPAVAPLNSKRASSSPEISSGRTPITASAASKNSSRLAASRDALVAVMRTRSTPSSSMRGPVLAEHRHGALDRVGMQLRGWRATPWPRRVMRVRRSTVCERRGRVRRGRRRAAASSWCRCRRPRLASRPLLRRAGPPPSGRRDRHRRRGGRRSARAGTSRRCGCRRRRPWAGGRHGRRRVAASRSRAYAVVRGKELVAVDDAFCGAHAARRLRAARCAP